MYRCVSMVGLLFVMLLMLTGCMRPSVLQAPDGVRLIPLRTVSTIEARTLLRAAGVEGIAVDYAVDCYRMLYSARLDGKDVQLSGLLALPRGVAPRRLVSFQHGTTTTRSSVPSKPDTTGLGTAIVFAGSGYALIAPDYPGLGESAGRHPYYIADAIAPAVVAMIEAAQRLDAVPKGPVFLSGFSQGGWASLAALRILESQGKPVLGSAPVAGVYNLRGVTLSAAMQGGARQHSLYLAYLAWGQAAYYGHPLDSVLTPEHTAIAERVFAGATPAEIVAALPPEPRRMFNRAFLDAFDRDGAHWLLESFAANDLIDMTPRSPMRLYYGSKDVDVVPEESRAAARAMHERGADVIAVDVGELAHEPSMLAAAPSILTWLGELDAAAK